MVGKGFCLICSGRLEGQLIPGATFLRWFLIIAAVYLDLVAFFIVHVHLKFA